MLLKTTTCGTQQRRSCALYARNRHLVAVVKLYVSLGEPSKGVARIALCPGRVARSQQPADVGADADLLRDKALFDWAICSMAPNLFSAKT